uniref:Uncharacterized protein n=1 Tax=Ditylenchus dipsaci TaxID=166011 RepID=A0A915D5A9_9BILA
MSLFFPLKILTVVLLGFDIFAARVQAIKNCPMVTIKAIIERAVEVSSGGADAALQMQVIRRIMEDVYGGNWGVLIIKNSELISSSVHWTIPDHHNSDGSPAFCLHTNCDQVINRVNEKLPPERLTVTEFDRRVADVFLQKRRQTSGQQILTGTSGAK